MAIAIELDRVVIRGYFKRGGCIVGAVGLWQGGADLHYTMAELTD